MLEGGRGVAEEAETVQIAACLGELLVNRLVELIARNLVVMSMAPNI